MNDKIVKTSVGNIDEFGSFLKEFNNGGSKTNFQLIDTEQENSVNYALIYVDNTELNTIFQLGINHGGKIEHKELQVGNYIKIPKSENYEYSNSIIEKPTGNSERDREVISEFNEVYQTDFKAIGEETWDGVDFVFINTGKSNLNTIYMLGVFFGRKIEKHRIETGYYDNL